MTGLAGTLGAFLLTWCAIPQLVATIRTRDTSGLSWGFLLSWGLGELLLGFYVFVEAPDWRLLLNYWGNAALVSVLVLYKFRNTRRNLSNIRNRSE